MKKKSTSKSAFFNFRVLIASVLCLFGVFVALVGSGAFSNLFAQPKGQQTDWASVKDKMPPAHRRPTSFKWSARFGQPRTCNISLIFPTKGKSRNDA